MENEPKVSIILVNFNGYSDTIECLMSLKKVTYKNFSVIVVDNGSTRKPSEEQLDYLRSNCTYIESGENLGFSGGNNIGIRYAENLGTDYILLLNNDTIVEPDFLSKLILAACEKDNGGIFGCKIKYYWDHDKIWFEGGSFDCQRAITKHSHPKTDVNARIEEVTFLTGCLMLIPTQIVEKVGLLDESYFLYAEDTDYCCRVMRAGYSLFYVSDAVIYHKEGASAGKNSDLKQYYIERNGLYIAKKYSIQPTRACLTRAYIAWKSVLRKRLHFYPVWCAYIDFFLHKKGKWCKH